MAVAPTMSNKNSPFPLVNTKFHVVQLFLGEITVASGNYLYAPINVVTSKMCSNLEICVGYLDGGRKLSKYGETEKLSVLFSIQYLADTQRYPFYIARTYP